MLGTLTEKLQNVIGSLSGKRKLSEENISDAVREVRLALLEADVNYGVTKTFVKRVKEKALGDTVLKSVSPSQQFIKVVHDELVELMGKDEASLNLEGSSPAIIMLCGLQGSGKTTHCAKLAKYLKKEGECKRPLMAACDLQRPAAIKQLQTLGEQANVDVFSVEGENNPITVAKAALEHAKSEGYDLLIVDTAGRLHIDDALMDELLKVKKTINPNEVLFVANASTGQDAVNTAAEFHQKISITGSILTMLDGNTRGGAAISIKEVSGQALKFEGIGEKLEDIQLFNPQSMADRILGMGDTINLVKKAQEHMDVGEASKLEKKMRTANFNYADYLGQIQTVKKMGSIKSLLGMLPGMGALKELPISDKEFGKVEAIIQSMTVKERMEECELVTNRRKRIAKGSGTSLDDVNKLVKSFKQAKKLFKNLPNMKQLEKMMTAGGPLPWR
jgi:signal recognition particle subunit SRP54